MRWLTPVQLYTSNLRSFALAQDVIPAGQRTYRQQPLPDEQPWRVWYSLLTSGVIHGASVKNYTGNRNDDVVWEVCW
jgi:hypothetical protein